MRIEEWDEKEDGRGMLLQIGGIVVVFVVMFLVAYAIVMLVS